MLQAHLREMKLQRIIRTQAHIQTDFKEVREWIALVRQEKTVVTERAHRHADLLQVE
jgi:hypothetical protein